MDVISTQRDLALRERDTLVLGGDHRVHATVVSYALEGTRSRVTLRVHKGMRAPGLPSSGTEVTLVRSTPDWHREGRRRRAILDRLQTMPWTHVPGTRPAPAPHGVAPANPLLALEVLR
jgi:hypothetical protein